MSSQPPSLFPSLCSVSLSYLSQDMYIHNMDEASTGISGRIQKFIDTLRWYDEDLCDHLLHQVSRPSSPPSPCLSHLFLKGIEPSFYSLRWMTTLFSREFDVLDTIRLWDSYLAETCREELITYLCCTMVLDQKDQLLIGDFGENLSLVPDLTSLCLSLSFPQLSLLPSSLDVVT